MIKLSLYTNIHTKEGCSLCIFIHKQTGERAYLLDCVMGIAPHTRLSEDAVAKLLKEAVESSYQKAGDTLCLSGEQSSRETVMNKIHNLHFPPAAMPAEKKTIPYLYIDADEDHISLQHRQTDTFSAKNEQERKTNCTFVIWLNVRSSFG